MAPPEQTLTVVLSLTAVDELHGIWEWNAIYYSPQHADTYIRFLRDRIDELAACYGLGKVVRDRPELRYVIIRRKPNGHGHIAVYRVTSQAVEVLHIFHTAQNWQTRLGGQDPTQRVSH